jgi:hypothetical protein
MLLFERTKIYKAKAVAQTIDTSTDFIWKEVRAGNLQAIVIANRLYRFRGCDLNKWLERGSAKSREEEIAAV